MENRVNVNEKLGKAEPDLPSKIPARIQSATTTKSAIEKHSNESHPNLSEESSTDKSERRSRSPVRKIKTAVPENRQKATAKLTQEEEVILIFFRQIIIL